MNIKITVWSISIHISDSPAATIFIVGDELPP